MSENLDQPPTTTRETALRVAMLGIVYALALAFVVALSPSMGFVSPHPTGEVGRIAAAPDGTVHGSAGYRPTR